MSPLLTFTQLYLCSLYEMRAKKLPVALLAFHFQGGRFACAKHRANDPLMLRLDGSHFSGSRVNDICSKFGLSRDDWGGFEYGLAGCSRSTNLAREAGRYCRNIRFDGFPSSSIFPELLPHIHAKFAERFNLLNPNDMVLIAGRGI